MRTWVAIVGSAAILAVSFITADALITVFAPDLGGPARRDRQRASDVVALKAALEKYRAAKGAYPIFPDNNVAELPLKEYLSRPVNDPLPTQPYRYVSVSGKEYGLLIRLEQENRPCLIGKRGLNFWGDPPDCPF